jgi:hypothetical protein
MNNFRFWLNEATKEDFFNLAELQRDRPERAMLKAQFATGGWRHASGYRTCRRSGSPDDRKANFWFSGL